MVDIAVNPREVNVSSDRRDTIVQPASSNLSVTTQQAKAVVQPQSREVTIVQGSVSNSGGNTGAGQPLVDSDIPSTIARESELLAGLATKASINHSHPVVTTTTPGFMSAADKLKLDGIQAGAAGSSYSYFPGGW